MCLSDSKIPPPRSMKGFTLIELLIALSIMTLLIGVLFAGLRMGDRAWSAIDEEAEALDELRHVWSYLDQRIRDIKPVYQNGDEGRTLLFAGESQALEFVSTSSYQNGFGGLYLIRLQLIPSEDTNQLVLRQWLYQPDVLEGGDDIPEWQPLGESGLFQLTKDLPVSATYSEAVLAEGIKSFEISYFGAPDTSEESEWSSEWNEALKLPKLLKFAVSQDDAWPEMSFEISGGMY